MNHSRNIRAGLIHDWDFSDLSNTEFRRANRRLRKNIKANLIVKWIVWAGVSTFGLFSYRQNRNYIVYADEIAKLRIKKGLPEKLTS